MTEGQGLLFLCATPIGNLEDITLRVLRILREVDVIAAEDTRHTRKLLNHFEIDTPLISYHKFNKESKGDHIIEMIKRGSKVALVSDAGTPGISDPGEELVKQAAGEKIDVVAVPGPSALVTALSVSGLSTKKFAFEGFLPRKSKERKKRLELLEQDDRTLIFYEAPHRVKEFLKDLLECMGNRKICIARELTKKYEEVFRGTTRDALKWLNTRKPLGEFTIVVEGNDAVEDKKNLWDELTVEEHLWIYINRGLSKKEAIAKVSQDRDMPKRQVYNAALNLNTQLEEKGFD